ncbi:hypothetical protein BDV93DRAFT_514148 [Ceratobasidium sp. AG-I]|nr:hypothetical protein BDV93DRAFT_514148 [Ceratobasidium sp. AG-I]
MRSPNVFLAHMWIHYKTRFSTESLSNSIQVDPKDAANKEISELHLFEAIMTPSLFKHYQVRYLANHEGFMSNNALAHEAPGAPLEQLMSTKENNCFADEVLIELIAESIVLQIEFLKVYTNLLPKSLLRECAALWSLSWTLLAHKALGILHASENSLLKAYLAIGDVTESSNPPPHSLCNYVSSGSFDACAHSASNGTLCEHPSCLLMGIQALYSFHLRTPPAFNNLICEQPRLLLVEKWLLCIGGSFNWHVPCASNAQFQESLRPLLAELQGLVHISPPNSYFICCLLITAPKHSSSSLFGARVLSA